MMIIAQGEVSPATLFIIVLLLSIPAGLVFSFVALAVAFSSPCGDSLARFFAGGALALTCINGLMTGLVLLDSHVGVDAGIAGILYLVALAVAFLSSGVACSRAFNLQPPLD